MKYYDAQSSASEESQIIDRLILLSKFQQGIQSVNLTDAERKAVIAFSSNCKQDQDNFLNKLVDRLQVVNPAYAPKLANVA